MPDVGRAAASGYWGGRDLIATRIDRARRPSVWLLVVGASAAAAATALASRHVSHPGAEAVLQVELIVGLSLAAGVWLERRPAGRLGQCLIVCAVVAALASMQASDDPELYTVGAVGRMLLLPVIAYALMTFPTGRLRGRARTALVGLAAASVVLISLPAVLVSPVVHSDQPLAACTADCPANALQVVTASPGVVHGLRWAGGAASALIALAIGLALVRRFARGTRPNRRAVAALMVVGAAGAVVFAVRWLAEAAGGSVELLDGLSWAQAVLLGLLPVAFVAPLLRAQIVAGPALETMLTTLARRPDARRWQSDVGSALGDPSLRLAFWSQADAAYLGVDGETVTAADERFAWHRIDRAGLPVAAILHDPELEADPELLRAAGTATLLSLETQRMEGEIRVARSRILAAAEEERRRLERDLHDGAQQRLIALRVKLGLIGEVDRAEARRVVAELAEDVDATLDELRSLAQGIYPPLLRTEGLVGALNAAARRSSLPTAVHTAGLGRYTAEVESAVYFCCLEALQNAGKHAGPDASATISVSAAGGSLRFEVEDTGVGFDPGRRGAGIGIANIDERMLAVGGHMHVISQPGCGTTLSGRVPLVRRAATTLSG